MADDDSFEDSFDISVSFNTSIMDKKSPISELKVALGRKNPSFEIEKWQQLLEKSYLTCRPKLLEDEVFSQVLPLAHSLLCQILEEIDTLLTDSIILDVDIVKEKLCHCIGILHLFEISVERVLDIRKMCIDEVKTLLDILPSSIKLVFEHCKTSSDIYGEFFKDLSKELANLFQEANKLLKLFMTVLEKVITYDTNVESTVTILLEALKLLGDITAISYYLDFKTFIKMTTSFVKLSILCQSNVEKFPINIIMSFKLIVKEADVLYSTFLDSNILTEERVLKGAAIIIHSFIKFTVLYCKYLDNDVLLTLVRFLSRLYRYTATFLDSGIINDSIVIDESITINESLTAKELLNVISSGTVKLFKSLLENHNFRDVYFECESDKDVNKFGYHLLTLAILKAIQRFSYDEYYKWVLGTQSILNVTFENFICLQEELCVGELLSSNYNFEGKTDPIDIYSATLLSVCKLVILVPCDHFNIIENLLLKYLLCGSFWCSLLSSDIWYFIGRHGSSNLCSSHVKYLMKVYAVFAKRNDERHDALEVCVLKNLIKRLYTLLPEKARHAVVIESNDIDAHLWTPFVTLLPYRTQIILRERLGSYVKNISIAVEQFFNQSCARTWFRLAKLLPVANKLSNMTEKEMIGMISQLWAFIASTIENCDHKYSLILSDFSVNVLEGTRYDIFCQDSIINAIANFSLHASPYAKIKISHYLEGLAKSKKIVKIDQPKVINVLAELNARFLEDANPWVRQNMLDCFVRIAHTCPNEALVAKMAAAISRNPKTSAAVPAYLASTVYYKFQDVPNIKSYLSCLAKDYKNKDGKHICAVFKDSRKDVKIPRMEMASDKTKFIENVNVSKELNDRVNRICDELNIILKQKNDINETTLRNLRAVLTKLTE